MKIKTLAIAASLVSCLSSALVFADTGHQNAPHNPHASHHIIAKTGLWQGRLAMTSPHESAFFINQAGARVGEVYDFQVSAELPVEYGFDFDEGTTANVSYVLTLYQQSSNKRVEKFMARACQFSISSTTAQEGYVDIRTESFNGALCKLKRVDGSRNFIVE